MSLPEFSNSQQLQKILISEINSSPQKRITFARYMNLVLYHQQYGYYSSGIVSIGSKGDFFTSSSLGKDFGELLAVQFEQMWQNLACPNPFFLVEMGAGNGELAQDILNFIQNEGSKDFIAALRYIIIERSPALIKLQQELLTPYEQIKLSWQTWSDLAPNTIEGCFFSNELVDALPVHLVTKNHNTLQEIYLDLQDNQLTETVAAISTKKLAQYFELIGIDLADAQYPPNYRTEVNLEALNWLEQVAAKLKRGYVLTIDYGYSADKYYRPARSQGTLQCHYQHRRHYNPYVNLGYQDITAHINFTALERHGELYDLRTIGFTQQGLFLMALGLGDRLNQLSDGKHNLAEIFKRRDALHQLIDPTGLGGFGVLIQGKNLTKQEQELQGLNTPSMF
ncbi:class I SAM-dependent methyltransferase [Pleurocapsales cyanobacterium LEGE 10410]|nr:class I SAM-dependent methyltransferase [Pleurocapsales cyanobacterium LEGE 10410]